MSAKYGFTVSKYYLLSWYTLLAALTALVLTSAIVPPTMILTVCLLSSVMITVSANRLAPYLRVIRLLIGLLLTILFAYEVRSYRNLEHGIRIMIEMIIGVLPLTLVTYRERRSYWLSVLNLTVIAIGSIALGESMGSFIAFIFFVVALVLSLNASNLYLDGQQEARSGTQDILPRHYLWHVAQSLPAGLLTAFVIFFTFPRAHSFSLGISMTSERSSTGFSGLIDLRSQGGIERSSALAMIVQSPDSPWLRHHANDLLLRGNALHGFDGEKWTPPSDTPKVYASTAGISLAKTDTSERHIVQIQLEHHTHRNLFYPDVLLSVLERPGAIGTLFTGVDGSLSRSDTNLTRFDYSVKTAPRVAATEFQSLSIQDLGKKIPVDLKSLATLDKDLRAAPWFDLWLQEVGVDPTATLLTLEKKLIAYFANNFRPSLASDHNSKEPFRDFLTQKREGHCEYFATATTLYLRSHGIPSRVVVGYRGGIFNTLIDALEVRDEHAHAWAEMWIPDYGWYPIDTTPLLEQDDGLASSLKLFFNALQFWFRKYFLNYDHATQKDLWRTLQNMAQKSTQRDSWRWESLVSLIKNNSLWGLIGVVLVISFMTLIIRKRKSPSPWPPYYLKFLARMEKAGFTKEESETLRAFHARILASPTLSPVDRQTIRQIDLDIENDLYRRGMT